MMPSACGVTSSRIISCLSSTSAAPWMPAPSATTSSGCTPLHGSRSKNSRDRLLDLRHARHAADEDDLLDLVLLEAARPSSVCRQMSTVRSMRSARQLLERLAVERALEVQRLVAAARDDEGQVDLGLAHARQLALGLLGRVLEALQRHPVLAQVDVVLLLEALDEPVDDPRVDVLAAEERVAGGRDDLEDAVAPISRIEMSNVPPPKS